MKQSGVKQISKNKKAYHDYFVEDTFEAGISLVGTEVKSVRSGNINLKDAYCIVKDFEVFVRGMHISPYEKGNLFNKDPLRDRKLLLHKKEIRKLDGEIKKQGYALIPLSAYFKDSKVKIELGLCKGKKLFDKRETEAKKSAEKEIDKQMKAKSRGQ